MSQQLELIPLSPAPNPAPAPGSESSVAPAPPPAPQRIPRWLVRAELFLRVFLRIYIGLAICYAPWSGQIVAYFPQLLIYLPWSHVLWDQNPLFLHFPMLGHFAASGAVRGLVSGLGLLNLWIAFHDGATAGMEV
jgi:hypothetical protein